ncbi:hypothetical protein F2P81_011411 [Scophthalmus maximus]|uniref:Uncharacterized protein n=1 Tax=Scophthalmus maximus TaxID=52904 RepID=A0A6A4STT8_SCOMX|nr:hypothetical protein F2P81_011411 [Scophthalmus maximus]
MSSIPVPPPKCLQKPLVVPHRHMFGPGPSNVPPRILKAGANPVIGHMHPEIFELLPTTADQTSSEQHRGRRSSQDPGQLLCPAETTLVIGIRAELHPFIPSYSEPLLVETNNMESTSRRTGPFTIDIQTPDATHQYCYGAGSGALIDEHLEDISSILAISSQDSSEMYCEANKANLVIFTDQAFVRKVQLKRLSRSGLRVIYHHCALYKCATLSCFTCDLIPK